MATERVGRAVLEFSTDSRQFNADVDKAGQKIVDLKKKAGDTSATFTALSGDLGKVSKAFTDLGGSVGPIAPALSKVQGMIAGVASGVATLGPVGAIAAVGLAAVTAGALAAVTAIGAIGTIAYKSTRAAADLGDELFTLSNKTGLSVEALSKFKFIAQQTDTDVDAITKSVSKLGQNLATGSKDTAAAIKAIGLSVADIRKMKPDEAFTAIITAIGKIPDAGQRAAIGAAIFGKQFREIAQLTQEDLKALGQQAEDLGLVFSTEFAVAGDRFNDALGAVGLSVDALQNKLGAEFLPVAIAFVEVVEEEFSKGLGVAGTAAGGLATTVADVALLVGQSLASIVEVGAPVVKWLAQFFAGAFITNLGLLDLFGRVVSAIGGMATILGKFDPTMGAVAAAAERTGASLQAFAKSGTVGVVQVTGAISKYADAVEGAAKSTGERLPGAVAKVKAEIAATAEKMREGQAASGGFGKAVDGLGEAATGLGKKLSDLTGDLAKAAAAQTPIVEQVRQFGEEALKATKEADALGIHVPDAVRKIAEAFTQLTNAKYLEKIRIETNETGRLLLEELTKQADQRQQGELKALLALATANAKFETDRIIEAKNGVDRRIAEIDREHNRDIASMGERTAVNAREWDKRQQQVDAYYNHQLDLALGTFDTLDERMRQQGVLTKRELADMAVAATRDYMQMRDSGRYSAEQIQDAWQRMIQANQTAIGGWRAGVLGFLNELPGMMSRTLTQMLSGQKSFVDGAKSLWQDLKASIFKIFDDILKQFLNKLLRGMLDGLLGAKGSFSQAFAGLLGSGGGGGLGQNLAGSIIGRLFGLGGSAATAGAFGAGSGIGSIAAGTGGVTMVGTGAGGVLVPISGAGAAAAGGGLAAGLAGGAAAAGGGVLLGMLGKQIFGGAGWKAGGFGAGTGAATGALIGSVVPVLGTAIGALVGGLAGLFSGWLGKTQAMKVNDARDQVIGQFGHSGTGEGSGFQVLGGELAKLTGGGDIFHALIKASNFKDFEAAVKRVQAALESTEYATVKVREATEQLTAERDKLTASGESEDAVLRQQAASYSTLFQTIQATGATAPASLEPILQKLVEMGLLVDATGQKVTDLSKTFPAVGEEAAKQGAAIETAMARSQTAIDQVNTNNPQAAVSAVRSALEALGTETAPEAAAALQQAIDALNTNNPQAALAALQSALDGLSAQHATQSIAQLGPAIDGQTKHWETFTDEAGQVWTVVGGVVGKIKGDLNDMAAKSELAFTRLGDVAADQADRARAALSSIGRGIPPISLRYRYQQDGPGLPDGADARGLSTGGLVTRYLATGGVVKTVGALAASAVLATAPLYAAHGTFVPKGPDTVPIMGEPGEFMQRVSAVRRHGVPAMEAINEGHATVVIGAGSGLPPTLALPTQAAVRAVAAVAALGPGESTRTPAQSTARGAQAMAVGGLVGPVAVSTGGLITGNLSAGSLTVPPLQTTLEVNTEQARRAVATIHQVPPIDVDTHVDLSGAFHTLEALPKTYSFDVQAETGSVLTDLTNQIEDLPRDLPIEVSADGLGAFQGTVAEVLDKLKTLAITPALDRAALSGVTGQLATLEKARKVTVAVTATGLTAVQDAIKALPPERRVAIALRLLGLSEVQAGIATIPTERQTAILLKLFGLTEVLAGIGSIPTSHPVAVPLKTAGLEVVRSEIASLPDRHRLTVAFESVGLAAVLADIASIPRTVDVAVNYRNGGTPAPPAPIPPAAPGTPRPPRPFPSPMPYPDPDSPLPTPLPYPDPRFPLPNPLPYPGPVIGGGGSGGGSFTIPHHRAGGVFATPHVGMIAEGGRPEIIGDEAFMARALARALAGMSGGFFQSLSRLPLPAIAPMPAQASIVRDVPSADTAATRGGDGSGGGVTFTGDLHIAVPPGTANPQAFGAQVADAFFGRLKRGGEHLDLMRHFVQKVRT